MTQDTLYGKDIQSCHSTTTLPPSLSSSLPPSLPLSPLSLPPSLPPEVTCGMTMKRSTRSARTQLRAHSQRRKMKNDATLVPDCPLEEERDKVECSINRWCTVIYRPSMLLIIVLHSVKHSISTLTLCRIFLTNCTHTIHIFSMRNG